MIGCDDGGLEGTAAAGGTATGEAVRVVASVEAVRIAAIAATGAGAGVAAEGGLNGERAGGGGVACDIEFGAARNGRVSVPLGILMGVWFAELGWRPVKRLGPMVPVLMVDGGRDGGAIGCWPDMVCAAFWEANFLASRCCLISLTSSRAFPMLTMRLLDMAVSDGHTLYVKSRTWEFGLGCVGGS